MEARGLRFGIVVSRFNSFITERLLKAALEALRLRRNVSWKIVRELLRPETTEADFELVMSAYGILRGTAKYEAVLKVWRAEQRERQKQR